MEDPGPAAPAAASDPGPPPGWRRRAVQTVRQPRRPWSSPPSRSGPSTATTNPDSSGFIGSTIELCRLFFRSMIRFVVVKSRQCGMTAPAQRATWHGARIARPVGELVLPWHRRSSYEPDAPARGVPQSPRWRVGLVCAKDAKLSCRGNIPSGCRRAETGDDKETWPPHSKSSRRYGLEPHPIILPTRR